MGFVYAALHKAGWYKIGYAADVGARHARGYWGNSHPAELCNSLAPSDWQLVGAWKVASEAEEQELHRQWNEGGIHKHDEIYPALEWPKIQRDLDTFLLPAPLPRSCRQMTRTTASSSAAAKPKIPRPSATTVQLAALNLATAVPGGSTN